MNFEIKKKNLDFFAYVTYSVPMGFLKTFLLFWSNRYQYNKARHSYISSLKPAKRLNQMVCGHLLVAGDCQKFFQFLFPIFFQIFFNTMLTLVYMFPI